MKEGKIDETKFREGFSKAYRREFLAKSTRFRKSKIHTNVYVTDENGIVIFDSEDGVREGEDYSEFNDVFLARKGEYGVRATRSDLSDSRTTVFYIAAPVYDGERLAGTLTVSRPETAMARLRKNLESSSSGRAHYRRIVFSSVRYGPISFFTRFET